jgi:sulfur-carrier protein adenylyltransferase/sulfurtransferase
VPGQIGLVQATEIMKLILGIGTPMIGRFFIYEALDSMMKTVAIGKNPDCPLCGGTPQITALVGEGSVSYDEDVCEIRT